MNGLLCPWFPVAGNHDIFGVAPIVRRKNTSKGTSSILVRFGMPLTTKGVGCVSIQTRESRAEQNSTSPTVKP